MNYKSEDEIWTHFLEYKQDVKSNPRHVSDYVGKDGNEVLKPLERPLTIEGFENFVYDKYKINIHDYLYSSDDRYKPFSTVCSRIKRVIRQDQIEGGMVGQYNASITQRLNGLKEQVENNTNHNIQVLSIDPLNDTTDNSTTEDSQP
jgi:hypothetical protein